MENEDKIESELYKRLKGSIRNYSYLPDYFKSELELADLYTDFILGYLINTKKGIGKIDKLAIKENGLNVTLSKLLEKQTATDIGYVDIIKQRKKYVLLKITHIGIDFYEDHSEKYNIKVPSKLFRLKVNSKKFFKKVGTILFNTFPKRLKSFMDSGFVKLILFLIALLTFILKWDSIKEFVHRITE